jgi:hypothetical protein
MIKSKPLKTQTYTMSDAAALSSTIRKKQGELEPKQVSFAGEQRRELAQTPLRSQGITDEQFPTAGLKAEDPKDELIEAQLSLADDKGQTPFGQVTYSDDKARWLLEKEKAVEYANFQAWFAKNFDKMAPAQKKWAREAFPEFYTQRQSLLKRQGENVVKLAGLKLNGVKSYDDLLTQYLAETGRLDIGPLEHLINPETAEAKANAQKNFRRGLLSPFRMFGEEATPQTVAERRVQSAKFAARERTGASDYGVGLGARTGFPPMNSNQTNQGTESWFQVLKGGV